MKRLKALIMLALALATTVPAYSAPMAECAIWLCLPGGFPPACGFAYAAMIGRIRSFKPPLPAFGECGVNPPFGQGQMNADFGYRAYIHSHQVCIEPSDDGGTTSATERRCYFVWDRYLDGVACGDEGHQDPSDPDMWANCETQNWVNVTLDGRIIGTYTW